MSVIDTQVQVLSYCTSKPTKKTGCYKKHSLAHSCFDSIRPCISHLSAVALFVVQISVGISVSINVGGSWCPYRSNPLFIFLDSGLR